MKQPWSLSLLAATALCALLAVCASTASAQAVLAGDGAFVSPISGSYAGSGGGFALRLGRRVRLPGAWETPELGFGYAVFAPGQNNADLTGFSAMRGVIGVRLTTSGVLRPGVFAHVGLGHVAGTVETHTGTLLVRDNIARTAFTWDGGVTLDLALGASFELGIHAAYDQILKQRDLRNFQWLELGGHLALVF